MINMVIYSYKESVVIQFDDGKVYLPIHLSWKEVQRQKSLDQVLDFLENKIKIQKIKREEYKNLR